MSKQSKIIMLTLALLSLSLRGMSQAITFDQLSEGKGIVRNSTTGRTSCSSNDKGD